jgi:hypothetical protein
MDCQSFTAVEFDQVIGTLAGLGGVRRISASAQCRVPRAPNGTPWLARVARSITTV